MLRTAPTYYLPSDIAPAASEQIEPPLDRPAWARALPAHATLVYVRDLGAAAIVTLLAIYLAAVAMRNPLALVTVLRRRAGV